MRRWERLKHRVDFLTRMLAKMSDSEFVQSQKDKAIAEVEALEPQVAELEELLQLWKTEAERLRIAQQSRAAGRAAIRGIAGVVKLHPRLN